MGRTLPQTGYIRGEQVTAGDFHPDGFVVFTEPIPKGSEVTSGNFKARITTIDLFPGQIRTAGTSPWTIDDWEVLARKLRLTSVTLDQVIGGAEAHEAFDLLKRYTDAVATEYGRDAERWLPETEAQRDELMSATAVDAGCFISGPSGCGKSLMTKWLAAKLSADGQGRRVFFDGDDGLIRRASHLSIS